MKDCHRHAPVGLLSWIIPWRYTIRLNPTSSKLEHRVQYMTWHKRVPQRHILNHVGRTTNTNTNIPHSHTLNLLLSLATTQMSGQQQWANSPQLYLYFLLMELFFKNSWEMALIFPASCPNFNMPLCFQYSAMSLPLAAPLTLKAMMAVKAWQFFVCLFVCFSSTWDAEMAITHAPKREVSLLMPRSEIKQKKSKKWRSYFLSQIKTWYKKNSCSNDGSVQMTNKHWNKPYI